MQTKFNIGDKVKILDGSEIEHYMGGWAPRMNGLIGKIGKIQKITIISSGVQYDLEETGYIFDERGLEKIETENIDSFDRINTKDTDNLDLLAALLFGTLF